MVGGRDRQARAQAGHLRGLPLVHRKAHQPDNGHIPLGSLAPIHVQEFYSFKAAEGRLDGKGALSSRSVLYIHSILRQALEKAVTLELILKNPCQKVTPPRLKKRLPRDYVVLDASQLSRFLEFCRGHRDYALIFTAAYTGMRQSELLGLQWEHVLWNDSSIKVEQSLNLLEGGVPYLGATKNASSSRVVKVAESVMKVLREHKKALAQRQLKEQGAFANQHNLVFPDLRTGGYENRKRVSARFKRLAEKAGYPGLRFHDLRHIHATILLTAGEFVKVVSQRLGHADVDTTLRTYAHVLPKQQDEAARRFAELLSGRK